MSAPSTSGLSVELLLRVIDVKYGCFALKQKHWTENTINANKCELSKVQILLACFMQKQILMQK